MPGGGIIEKLLSVGQQYQMFLFLPDQELEEGFLIRVFSFLHMLLLQGNALTLELHCPFI